jgi:ERCC4-type nuclease
VLVSPMEPAQLKALGNSSFAPESYGCDYLWMADGWGMVGVQRKEVKDLVASQHDDRLAREVIAMKECDVGIWLLEGRMDWSSEGVLLSTRTHYTRSRHHGLLFTLLFQGFSLLYTDTIAESGLLLLSLENWLKKEKHRGVIGRTSTVRGEFGKASTEEWQAHFLSGLPGISVVRGERIVEHFGGLPFRVTGNLREVEGVGNRTAERIERLINGRGD